MESQLKISIDVDTCRVQAIDEMNDAINDTKPAILDVRIYSCMFVIGSVGFWYVGSQLKKSDDGQRDRKSLTNSKVFKQH